MDAGGYFPLILVIVGLILLQFLFRKRRQKTTHRDIVQSLLSEVRANQALVKAFGHFKNPKKFEIIGWRVDKNKVDFLDQSVRVALSDAFTMAEDFNQQIQAAKKYKSASHTVTLNVEKLEEPLAKSRQGLEQWLLANGGTEKPATKYPSIFDDFFGRRS